MTAVETSVTTINSLSHDFTNLDDQPSQTLTDTPGFKPFTLLWLLVMKMWHTFQVELFSLLLELEAVAVVFLVAFLQTLRDF